jgi:hypothetical protein
LSFPRIPLGGQARESITRRRTWVFKVDKVVEVVMTGARERCTKLFARIAKRNVKFRLSLERTVRFIVRTVFQSIKKAAKLSMA